MTENQVNKGGRPTRREQKVKQKLAARKKRGNIQDFRMKTQPDPELLDRIKASGYEARIVNDENISRRKRDGWEMAVDALEEAAGQDLGEGNSTQGTGANPSVYVGTNAQGQPQYGHLMVIEREVHEEIQREQQAVVDETDNAIKEGKSTVDQSYIPKEGIKYRA